MEAATPLNLSSVRRAGDKLVVDHLVISDECVVDLCRDAEDPAQILLDAISIGARVLDREHTGADVEVVRAELEKTATEVSSAVSATTDRVNQTIVTRLGELFGTAENAGAVPQRVTKLVERAMAEARDDLRRQFSSSDDSNPLAGFHKVQLAVTKQVAEQHGQQLATMSERMEAMRLEVEKLRAEREKLEEIAAERDRGTAKGRTFEEAVADAVDAIAQPQGDDAEAVGDHRGGSGKSGDVVVSIDGCNGPARGRIVFEAKNSRLSRPEALRELDRAKAERNADFAVLVVAHEEKVPARMLALREYNGDKMVVAYDPEDGPLPLQVAYALARARVLMKRSDAEGIDGAAVTAAAEKALTTMGEVQRIKQQLTASKTAVDKAGEIVDTMALSVKTSLAEIQATVAAAEAAGED